MPAARGGEALASLVLLPRRRIEKEKETEARKKGDLLILSQDTFIFGKNNSGQLHLLPASLCLHLSRLNSIS